MLQFPNRNTSVKPMAIGCRSPITADVQRKTKATLPPVMRIAYNSPTVLNDGIFHTLTHINNPKESPHVL